MELHAAEEAKKRLVNEKLLLEEKFSIVEKKKTDEVSILNVFIIRQLYTCFHITGFMAVELQVQGLEKIFAEQRKALKLQLAELEKELDVVKQKLIKAESNIATKDKELLALQINLNELEELREMKEVQPVLSFWNKCCSLILFFVLASSL